jgi:hypothetical protein
MIDKVSGKVAYSVMSFGGFLGIGDRHHPLPWHVLTYDTGQRRLAVPCFSLPGHRAPPSCPRHL